MLNLCEGFHKSTDFNGSVVLHCVAITVCVEQQPATFALSLFSALLEFFSYLLFSIPFSFVVSANYVWELSSMCVSHSWDNFPDRVSVWPQLCSRLIVHTHDQLLPLLPTALIRERPEILRELRRRYRRCKGGQHTGE